MKTGMTEVLCHAGLYDLSAQYERVNQAFFSLMSVRASTTLTT